MGSFYVLSGCELMANCPMSERISYGSFATESVRINDFNKNEPTWFPVSVLPHSSLSFVLPDSTPTRWFTVHCVKLTEWGRGTGLGNNIQIPNMKRSSAEMNFVMLCVDWWPFARSIGNEGGAESDWEPCIPWFTTTGNATEWMNKQTNVSEQLFLVNWITEANHEIHH